MQDAIDNISGKPIQFTESAPLYDWREGDSNICIFKNLYYNPWQEEYEKFLDYYQNTYDSNTNGRLFILYPDSDVDMTPQYHYIRAQSETAPYQSPMIYQHLEISDDILWFFDRNSEGEGNLAPSVKIAFCAPAVSNEVAEQFDRRKVFLKFGNNSTNEWYDVDYFNKWYDGCYFNIYMPIEVDGVTSNVCIGTCHYTARANLSVEWFERFIYRNLFLGD